MKAEIITIGDELLIGQTVDTNSAWIGKQLNEMGIAVYQITSITDSREHILNALNDAVKRSEIVLITGGLGPTRDDITKNVLCEFFDTKLVFHEPSFEDIKTFILKRRSELNELNRKQAEVPEKCTPIQNLLGTAPGMWFEKDKTVIVSMPGVPYEMRAMMQDTILPELKKQFVTGDIVHKTILIHGLPESVLAEKISDWEDHVPEHIKIAYLPSPGIIKLRFSSYGNKKDKAEKAINDQIAKLSAVIPDNIVGYEKQKIEEEIGEMMKENKLSLSTAESCTGGRIAQMITSIAGASQYYLGAVVAYDNDIKMKTLGVNLQSIMDYGSVSEAIVREMAEGIRKKFNSTFSIATSGVAGPTGGTEEKPVGTTWISVSGPEKTIAKRYNFAGEREQIIDKAARTALNMLRLELIKFQSIKS